jgi:hypothetical protein
MIEEHGETKEISSTVSTIQSPKPYRMDFDRYRDDQLNTGVIAALLGGFSLTNSWEMEISGSPIDTVTYVLAIVAVHSCTCSALTSAFLYRKLTRSDPDEATLWMEKHYIVAGLPHVKFVIGTLAYLSSVILVAFKELAEQHEARLLLLVIGLMGCTIAMGVLFFLSINSPTKATSKVR